MFNIWTHEHDQNAIQRKVTSLNDRIETWKQTKKQLKTKRKIEVFIEKHWKTNGKLQFSSKNIEKTNGKLQFSLKMWIFNGNVHFFNGNIQPFNENCIFPIRQSIFQWELQFFKVCMIEGWWAKKNALSHSHFHYWLEKAIIFKNRTTFGHSRAFLESIPFLQKHCSHRWTLQLWWWETEN